MANATTASLIVVDGGRGSGGGGTSLRQLIRVFNSEPVANSTAKVESIAPISTINGFDSAEFGYFGVWAKVDTTGTFALTYNLLESWDDTTGNYVAPNIGGVIATGVSTTAAQIYSVAPTPMPKFRLQAVANSFSATDVVVTMYLFMVR